MPFALYKILLGIISQKAITTLDNLPCHTSQKLPSFIDHTATATKTIILKETDKESKIKQITITHLGDSPFVLLPEKGQDKEHRYSPLFSHCAGWSHHKACDAVLFSKKGNKFYEVFIELKSDSPKGCERQFKATEDFTEYAWLVLKTQKGYQRLQRERRRIVFNTKHSHYSLMDKQPTHPKNFTHDKIKYIKVSNNDTLTPDKFC